MDREFLNRSLENWGIQLNTKPKGDTLTIKNNIAEGVLEANEFEDYDLLRLDLNLKEQIQFQDFEIVKLPFVRLTFIVPDNDNFSTSTELDELTELEKFNKYAHGVYCTNTNLGYAATFEQNVALRIVEVRLSEALYLEFVNKSPKLKKFMNLDQDIFFYEEIPINSRWIINELFDIKKGEYYEKEYISVISRVLITNFFISMENREEIEVSGRYNFNIQATLKAQSLVNNAYDKPISIDDISKEVGLSESRLRNLFRQTFGISIMTYYQDFRLQKSKELLTDPNNSISFVALELGFSSASHFSQAFKKKYNVTPKEYIEYYYNHREERRKKLEKNNKAK